MKWKSARFYICLGLLIVVGCRQPEPKAPTQYTMAQFMDIVQISGIAFSPDESKIMINSKETGIYNAFEIDIKSGEKKQLTNSTDEAIFSTSYFPGDNRILFESDKGGNEITHLYVQTPEGSVNDLIADSTAKASFLNWSYDKKWMYYTSNGRDERYFDLYRIKVDDQLSESKIYAGEIVYKNEQGLQVASISNDDRYIALSKKLTTNNSDMYLLDTQTGKTKLISEHQGDILFLPQYFSLDGKKLFYLTNDGSEFMYLASYDIAGGTITKVEEAPWDLMYAYQSRGGKYRVIAVNNDARTEIKIYDGAANQPIEIAGLPEGDITAVEISDKESKMAFYVSSSKSPSNLFVYDFNTKEVKQLTNTMGKEIDPAVLVAGEVVRFKSYDGLEIPCLLYKPHGLREGQKVPALLFIHGGPGGQTRLNYSPMIQHIVNHGYVVLAVNNRGSSGYGKSFYAADDRKHGDADLRDCVESKKLLASFPYVDTSKIGIMGGSYGGYMTMAALTFAPEEFNVGVNIFGVTNWLRTLKSMPPWWASVRESLYTELGNPFEDSVALYNKSPLFHAHKIVRPFIVLQGANDPRVLKVESDEIVAAAQKNGIPVEYVVFPDEGHGFVKKENNIKANEEIVKFLDKHLKGSTTASVGAN